MSITQTYFLAHKARAKLSHEAARPDHNLRLLVGHANLLDSLMVDLADAEREQESWFNQSVRGASPKAEERHVQWADEVAVEDDWEADSSDSDSDTTDDEDEDVEMADVLPLRRIPSHSVAAPPSPQLHTIMDVEEDEDDDDFEDDDDEDYGDLSLTRTSSRSVTSPPELEHDSDSSEDESMPPSPPTATMPTFTQKQRGSTVQYYDSRQDEEGEDNKAEFYSEGYYLPPRNPARIVSTISVY
ncbi:Protein kinase C signaling pathway involved MAPKK protein [Hypoxylon texense]